MHCLTSPKVAQDYTELVKEINAQLEMRGHKVRVAKIVDHTKCELEPANGDKDYWLSISKASNLICEYLKKAYRPESITPTIE